MNIEEVVLDGDYDWHLFDQLRNLEARRVGDAYEVRPVNDVGATTTMTAAEFDRFRSEDSDLPDMGEDEEYGGES